MDIMFSGSDIVRIAIVLGVILISMTLHEAMHGFMAYWLGDDTAKHSGRLTFNPIKHIDPFMTILLPLILAISNMPVFGGAKPVPFNPNNLKFGEWGAALVAFAGPFVNLFIAFVSFAAYAFILPASQSATAIVLAALVTVNLGFFVFNMIPIPPLDGSRVLYALAPDFARRTMEAIEQFGVIFIFVIVMIASPLISTFMGTAITMILKIFSNIFGLPVA